MVKKASLGNTTVNVSPFERDENNLSLISKKDTIKDKKWMLLNKAQELLKNTNARVLGCQKTIGKVEIQRSGDVSRLGGVMACGSVWLCPVCSQRIAFERCEMIRQASQSGFNMLLVTATLQHNKGDALSVLLDALKEALRKLKQGKWWKTFRERFGVEAYVSSYEITYGFNGWHPHSHILIFLSKEVDVDDFWQRLKEKYVKVVSSVGQYASLYHGLDVEKADENAGEYLTKWSLGSELTGQFSKNGKGLTFWDLVESERKDLVLEYAQATYGLKSLTWSHGAKEKLGVSDFEVEKPDEWVTVASVSDALWKVIRSEALQGVVLRLAVLDDNGQALDDYLNGLEKEVT